MIISTPNSKQDHTASEIVWDLISTFTKKTEKKIRF